MSEIIIELTVNLARARIEFKKVDFEKQLRSQKADRKETETLIAGYNKAINDMEEVFMTLAEM